MVRIVIFADPARQLASLYSASARQYAALWEPVIRDAGERLVRAVPIADDATVLDVGAGAGSLVPCLRSVSPRGVVISVDLSIGMISLLRERYAGAPAAVMDAQSL